MSAARSDRAKGRAAWVVAAGAAAVAAFLAGCKKDPEFDGVGGWHLGKTTLADSGGVCTPQDGVTWCHSNPSVSVGNQSASVDLYFRGDNDGAPLVEILLAITACRPERAGAVLSDKIGEPDERAKSVLRWNGERAVIFAQLPAEDGTCEINFVAPSDKQRIAELAGPPAQ